MEKIGYPVVECELNDFDTPSFRKKQGGDGGAGMRSHHRWCLGIELIKISVFPLSSTLKLFSRLHTDTLSGFLAHLNVGNAFALVSVFLLLGV